MKLSSTVKAICCTYRQILRTDGIVEYDELIEMLKVDDDIADKYKTEKGLRAIALHILTGLGTREQANYRRMKMYMQGLTPQQMAEKEKVSASSIRYWLRVRGLEIKKEPAATGK